MKKVCLVSSGNIGSNPRIVKEASALAEAGFDVRVVYFEASPLVRNRDEDITSASSWRTDKVMLPSRFHWNLLRLVQLLAKLTRGFGIRSPWLDAVALSPISLLLYRYLTRIPAALYISHNLPALPAVAIRAVRTRTLFAFDSEDLHSGEQPYEKVDVVHEKLVDDIERRWLPHAAYVSAAAPLIAAALKERYCLHQVISILNVFDPEDEPSKHRQSQNREFSIYWFSQTIGLDRGLHTAIEAISLSNAKPQLVLQGHVDSSVKNTLVSFAQSLNPPVDIQFLSPVVPSQLQSACGKYWCGLASETRVSLNRDICLTNKIFSYLSAGTPVLASGTKGQRQLESVAGQAICFYPVGDVKVLAEKIDLLFLGGGIWQRAHLNALELSQSVFNWNVEKHKFLGKVAEVLA